MIAIVTDSTAYLTKQEANELGIRIVPMSYTVAGQMYNESYSDQNGEFESLIFRNMSRCTTSQAPRAAFMSVFEELLRQDYEILCIVISSRLSGTYSSASLAAKEINPDKIVVVDSLSTAGGLSILARKAKKLAEKGLTLQALTREIETARDRIGISFSVDNMDALRRSGRLGIVRQSVGTILNIKPILLCKDGAIISYGIARGKTEQIKELVGTIPSNAKEIIVHYLEEIESTKDLFHAIKNKFPSVLLSQVKLGPVLGIHLGLGVIGISWISE